MTPPSLAMPPTYRRFTLGPLFFILSLLELGACVVQAPPPPAPAVQERAPEPSSPQARVVQLEDGTYVEISEGVEPGFAHCCGNDEYIMEVDCSDSLLRCYEHKGRRWKQTYGKHCKRALEQECYEQTCARVCDAFAEINRAR